MTPTMPHLAPRHVHVGSFSRYRDLKRAVDSLSVARVPDKRMTVLGRGLRWSPPLTAERAARIGARLGGAVCGTCLLLLALAGAVAMSWLGAAIVGVFLGTAIGGVLGLASWRVGRDRAMLPESGHVEVDRYDLLVDRDDLGKARKLLGDSRRR
jgi:hypothetical protein